MFESDGAQKSARRTHTKHKLIRIRPRDAPCTPKICRPVCAAQPLRFHYFDAHLYDVHLHVVSTHTSRAGHASPFLPLPPLAPVSWPLTPRPWGPQPPCGAASWTRAGRCPPPAMNQARRNVLTMVNTIPDCGLSCHPFLDACRCRRTGYAQVRRHAPQHAWPLALCPPPPESTSLPNLSTTKPIQVPTSLVKNEAEFCSSVVGVSNSLSWPLAMARMRSEKMMVSRRCAMVTVVRSANTLRMVFWISASVCVRACRTGRTGRNRWSAGEPTSCTTFAPCLLS